MKADSAGEYRPKLSPAAGEYEALETVRSERPPSQRPAALASVAIEEDGIYSSLIFFAGGLGMTWRRDGGCWRAFGVVDARN